jgi:hypothetical protein
MPTETKHARRLSTTWAAYDHMTLGRQSTRNARHRSYIKLKFIKNVCSSCKTLAKPSCYSQSKVPLYIINYNLIILKHKEQWIRCRCNNLEQLIVHSAWRWPTRAETCSGSKNKQTPWSQSASELHRPSDRHLSKKWMPTFADRGCHVVSVMDPYGRILGFLDRSRYFSIKQLLSLYLRGWVDPVPDPLLFFFW